MKALLLIISAFLVIFSVKETAAAEDEGSVTESPRQKSEPLNFKAAKPMPLPDPGVQPIGRETGAPEPAAPAGPPGVSPGNSGK